MNLRVCIHLCVRKGKIVFVVYKSGCLCLWLRFLWKEEDVLLVVSVCLFIDLSLSLSMSSSIATYISIWRGERWCLSTTLCVCVCRYLSVYQSICLSRCSSDSLCTCQTVYLSFCLCFCLQREKAYNCGLVIVRAGDAAWVSAESNVCGESV